MNSAQLFAPSPRAGEGWGEGVAATSMNIWQCYATHPSP